MSPIIKFGLLVFTVASLGVNALAQTTLIPTNAVWRFLDDGSDQGTAWTGLGFADGSWPSGPAVLGFGDGDEGTTNVADFVTYYYRHTFNVANASSITNLRTRMMRDDGAVVYLNGTEVFRSNMPTGLVDYLTFAASVASDDGRTFAVDHINPGLLLSGANVLAVEVHQANATSSDVRFALELAGNPLPSIAINSPTNGQTITASSLLVSGSAMPGGPGVDTIQVYAGATLVGQSTNADFAVSWQDVAPGNYSLTARITDVSGLTATSAPVNVTVQAPPPSILVSRGSSWKYHNLGQDLFTTQPTWRQPGYDDSAANGWAGPGPGPLGDNVEGGVQRCATVLSIGPANPRHPVVFYRRTFNLSGPPGAYQGLILRIQCDDSAAIYLNGVLLFNDGDAPGSFAYAPRTMAGADETTYRDFNAPATALVAGVNVLAVENHNVNATSSDLQFDLEIEGIIDTTIPTAEYDPAPGNLVLDLPYVNALFSEGVAGVQAEDLLINGEPAASVVTNNPNDYTFYFPAPPTGVVQVAWAPAHGITDTAPLANPFGGGSWTYTLDPNATASQLVISEFLAGNDNGIRDEDGQRNDWIEIYNPGPLDSSLAGWYLTDVQGSNKWRFPGHINMTLGVNQYLIVWASSKDRTNNIVRLHTNFQLSQGGEYLALLNPAGEVASEFAPTYPSQTDDVSYGRDRVDPNIAGYFTTPTPGEQNSTSGANFAPEPAFSMDNGVFAEDSIQVSLSIPNPPAGNFEIRYTTDGTEPANNSPLYTGPLTFGTNVFVKARVFAIGAPPLPFPSPVIARTYQFLDASARDFNSNLPIIIMSTSGRTIPQNVIGGGVRTRGACVVIDTFRGRASVRGEPDYIGMAQFEIFGQTSAGFAKQPFNIELNDAYGNDVSESLLGLPAEADWKLRNPYSDKCLMNDFLAYELYEDMGNYSVRRRMVELFVDTGGGKISYPGDYYGVLCFLEKIERDGDRVDIEPLTPANTTEPEIAGGYIVKKDKDSAGDRNFTVAGGAGHGAQTLKMHDPKPREVTTAQVNWIQNYLNRMTAAMYATDWLTRTGTNHYSHYLDVDSWVDQHWIVEFTKQIDGYRISNFMSKSRFGKLTMSPIWDWNLAFGNANYLEGGRTNGWYWNIQGEGMNDGNHIWLRRLLYGVPAIVGTGGAAAAPTAVMNSGDPDFIQKVIDRWGELRTNVFNGDRLIARIDEIAALLTEAAGRNYQKYNVLTTYLWPNPDGTGNWNVNYANQPTYAAIIEQMKNWTRGRFNWVDSQFVGAPIFNRPDGPISTGASLTIDGPAGATLYYTLDGSDPRAPGGNVSPSAQIYSGPITLNNSARAFARARIGTSQYSWSPPAIATLYAAIPGLRITEIMYHPANSPTPSFTDEDFEFIELRNVSGGPLNISGFRISGGIDFVFPNMAPLAAGARVLVVNNLPAFSALYNTNGMIIAGEFINPPGGDNNLDNTGESLTLKGRLAEPIMNFRYDDDWRKATDGLGFSLVIADDSLPTTAWNDPANWRVGGVLNGTPGAGEPAPAVFPQVVITEALTHTDLPSLDTIELHNAGSSAADISNWYLSDDRLDVKKFRVPNGTVIPAGGFLTFDEDDFNAGANGFGLSSTGDEIYLASADALGELTGYLTGFSFGAQKNGVTFGRHVTSLQEERFVSQAASSLNAPNAGPLIPNIVISEFNYHPPDVFTNNAFWNNSEHEFIELHNRGGSPVNLYYPGDPNLVWKLEQAAEFDFPPGTAIPAGGYLVLVNFNPLTRPDLASEFRALFNVPASVPILGPLRGDLSNDEESISLYQPDTPFTNENNAVEVPYVLVEEVQYNDESPWPVAADGVGLSLQRRALAEYSDDPINWEAGFPTPGRAFAGSANPNITSQPADATVIEGNPITVSVTAGGPGPFRYQWRKDGANLTGQTNSSLSIFPSTVSDSGDYQVVVLNNSGSAASRMARIVVRQGLRFLQHPVSLTVRPPDDVTFSVSASSTTPITYQWRFNGQNLPGETGPTLLINNVTNIHDGVYDVVCTDDDGPVVSQPAVLTVLLLPRVISPSTLAPLRITAVVGETLNLAAELHGTKPIFARWRLTRTSGGTITLGDTLNYEDFSTMTHVVAANSAGRVILSITNIAGGSLGNNATWTNALLTVLADADGDKIPDQYEDANGMDRDDPADAGGDLDGDTSINRDEYIAGTDPQDPSSYLKVDRVETIGPAAVHFGAISNRSYSVQYSDDLVFWQNLINVGGRPTNWSATATDLVPSPQRYYRLVTPAE